MKVLHGDQTKKFVCDTCGKALKNAKSLQYHIDRTHLNLRSDPCKYCGKDFSHNRLLEQHIKVAHLGTLSFTCPICNRSYQSRARVNRHLKDAHKIFESLKNLVK